MKYFDYASTTPLDDRVLETYIHVLKKYFVNSESIYPSGLEVNKLMNKSRQQVADLLRVKANEIIFTSGASEASNMAIKGTCLARREKGRHIITTCIEHSSVANSVRWLVENEGYEATILSVNEEGKIDLSELRNSIREDTVLVSIMWVNNESGTIEPIEEVKKIVGRHKNCYLHVDCVQAVGKIPLDLEGIDLASFSAHKIYGLKGSGILMKKQHVVMLPLISGGQQEYHLRGGTANSPANIVWGKTLRLALENLEENRQTVQQYNDYVRNELKQMKDIVINSPADASPYVLNFSCLSIPSEVMMNALSLRDYCVSAQSTCESGQNYSAVMEQMFRNHTRLKGIIRVSFSHHQSWEDIKCFIRDLKEIVEKYG